MKLIKNFLKNLSPVRLIVSSFLLIIIIGTLLLSLPVSVRNVNDIDILTSLFTSTSATCVTGLVLCDTYSHWSVFGQVVILILIQLGGIGLVSFASGFVLIMRKKLNLRNMQIVKEYTSGDTIHLYELIKTILLFTFSCETLGAAILMIRFVPIYKLKGIWISIFLSISSYCNAGFDILGFLQPDASLALFYNDPLVLFTLSFMIILGGIGFIVAFDLYSYFIKRRIKKELNPHITLHSRIVLKTTAFLLVFGTILVFILEYNNTLREMSFFDKLNNSFFQSVTARTAGFSTINQAQLLDVTKILTIILMFIGASPSSTGGGIKTTTFIIIIFSVISVLKGQEDTTIKKWKINKTTVYRALTILILSMLVVILTFSVITLCEPENVSTVDELFEAVSAFATVGITASFTPSLSIISKLAVIVTMFIGRVGPISLIMSLHSNKKNTRLTHILPEGKVIVG